MRTDGLPDLMNIVDGYIRVEARETFPDHDERRHMEDEK